MHRMTSHALHPSLFNLGQETISSKQLCSSSHGLIRRISMLDEARPSRRWSPLRVRAQSSRASVGEELSSAFHSSTRQSAKESKDLSSGESALILIRHGESMWNEKNLFTGCVDVALTKKGVEEAIEAGKRIAYLPVDRIFTSTLIRAQMTAMLAMIQHKSKMVPIVVHNENEQAKTWSQIYSEDTRMVSVPVITAWQLNERMYGELQGLNKQETAELYGKEQVHEWRRSYDIPPPKGESLEMCAERSVAYFKDNIEPKLQSGKNVMIAAHGNSLRSIIMYLERLTPHEVMSLELSTGVPLLYVYKEQEFKRRGSPVGPAEAGLYAYTRDEFVQLICSLTNMRAPCRPLLFILAFNLADYKEQLEEMAH